MLDEPEVRQICALVRDGHVLTDAEGRLPSFTAEHPWIDVDRRAAACGDPTAVLVAPQALLRSQPATLLNVFASRRDGGVDGRVDGTWRPLDELDDLDGALAHLREIEAMAGGLLKTPARRPAWFSTTWYDEVDAWIDAELAARGRTRTGPTVPKKVWSMSAVLQIPCEPAPVWFKASCRHFHAEPALTRLVVGMLPEHAPPVIAADEDRSWLLMDAMPGADEEIEDSARTGMGGAAGRAAATLQLRSLDHLVEIEAAGVPVRRLTDTLHGFDQILTSSVELDELTATELATARSLRDVVHAAVAELEALGFPTTLVHGDLHPGNVAHDGDALVFYDWSDAALSHPLLDLVHLTRSLPDDEAAGARTAYADVWQATYPDSDVLGALPLAQQVNVIYQMVTFEQIYRSQEDASYWEMSGVVARYLRQLPERFPRLPMVEEAP